MKQKTERRLEDLERETEAPRRAKVIIRDAADGSIRNQDGTPYVDEPLPPGTRVIEIVIVDPPNRPPWTDPRVEPTVKPQLGQVRH